MICRFVHGIDHADRISPFLRRSQQRGSASQCGCKIIHGIQPRAFAGIRGRFCPVVVLEIQTFRFFLRASLAVNVCTFGTVNLHLIVPARLWIAGGCADVDDHAAGIFPDRQPEVLHLDFMGLRPGVATDRLRHAEDEKQFIRLADGSLIFEAKILLTDFFRVIDADPTEFGKLTEEVETLAGLLLEIKGDFPRRREIIEYDDYRFQVLEIDNRRILKVKFNRISDQGKERQEE